MEEDEEESIWATPQQVLPPDVAVCCSQNIPPDITAGCLTPPNTGINKTRAETAIFDQVYLIKEQELNMRRNTGSGNTFVSDVNFSESKRHLMGGDFPTVIETRSRDFGGGVIDPAMYVINGGAIKRTDFSDTSRVNEQNTHVLSNNHAFSHPVVTMNHEIGSINRYKPPPVGMYNPGIYGPACGCFYDKHTIIHLLGLCKFSRFKSKCKSPSSASTVPSKKPNVELNYTFLDQTHWKIYDFNKTLIKGTTVSSNTSSPDKMQYGFNNNHTSHNKNSFSTASSVHKLKSGTLGSTGTGSLRRTGAANQGGKKCDKIYKSGKPTGRVSALTRLKQSMKRGKSSKGGQKGKLLAGTSKIGRFTMYNSKWNQYRL